jgi:hypothetical protein
MVVPHITGTSVLVVHAGSPAVLQLACSGVAAADTVAVSARGQGAPLLLCLACFCLMRGPPQLLLVVIALLDVLCCPVPVYPAFCLLPAAFCHVRHTITSES